MYVILNYQIITFLNKEKRKIDFHFVIIMGFRNKRYNT